MEVKVELKPTNTIIANLGIQERGPAHKFFTNTCYKYMGPFVPGGVNSHINQNVFIEADSITYLSPDSHYHFIGEIMGPNVPIEKVGNLVTKWISLAPKGGKYYTGRPLDHSRYPGTGAHWDRLMITSKGDQVVKEVQDFVDKRRKND